MSTAPPRRVRVWETTRSSGWHLHLYTGSGHEPLVYVVANATAFPADPDVSPNRFSFMASLPTRSSDGRFLSCRLRLL